jgi:ribosome recycling factor
LTEERRKELVKMAHEFAERSRNEVRQVRRDANDRIKRLEKDKEISEDEMHSGHEQVQKLTDNYIDRIAAVVKKKESEILEI